MPTYIEVEKNQFNQLPNASGDGTVIFAVSSSGMIVLKDVNGNNISSEETSSYSISASYSPSQTPDITDNTDLHYVGINNLTPSYSLDVTGTTQTTNLYLSGGDYAGAYIKTANLNNYLTLLSGTPGDSGSGFTAAGDISISATQGAVRLFSNSDEGITVANDSGILVGINQTNPQYTLDVSGKIANSIGDLIIQAGIDNETPWLGVPADLYLNADCGGHEVYIGDAGKIYLGGGGTMVDCSLGNIYNIGAYKLTGGDSNSYVGCNGGYVGIGMTTPNYTLDVNGDINFTGNLLNNGTTFVPNNAISASYVPNLYPTDTSSFITNNQTSSMTVATASYVNNAISASYYNTSSLVTLINTKQSTITTGSTYNITASAINFIPNLSNTASYVSASNVIGTVTSASYSLSSSAANSITFIPNLSNTASYITASNVVGLTTMLINSSSYAQTSSYLIGYVPPTLVTSSISASWASSSLSSNAVSQSNLIGTSSLYSQTYILTGSYKEIITSSYTLTSTENGRLLIVNSGSIVTLTVPSTLPQGFACSMFQSGSGQVTVLGSGVNIRNRAGLSSSYAQYSVISLIQLDTNGNYLLGGDVG